MASSYYDSVAEKYDTLVDRPLRGVRAAATRALDPGEGATVLDLGCGSGVNFRPLRSAVGPAGTVVGIDVSPGMLGVARQRVREAGWENVRVARGDAKQPPVAGPDAVFASLLAAFFEKPGRVVRRWADIVGPGGRIGLLDFGRATGAGRLLNPAFVAFTGAVSPGSGSGYDPDGVRIMERNNATAHRTLASVCTDVEHSTHFLGFARVTVGTVTEGRPDGQAQPERDSWP